VLLLLLCGLVVVLLAGAGPAAAQPDPGPEPIPPPPTAPPPAADPGVPQPEPGPPPIPPAGADNPAPWDIGGQVRRGITDFFHNLVTSALNPVLETMGETVLATPDLTSHEQIRTMWTANLVIANTVFVLFIVAGGFVIASRETLQTSYGLKELAPRIVVAGLASNLSLLLVEQMIEFANAVTAGIAGQGVDPATAAQALAGIWENAAQGTNFLASLLMIAIVVMAIIVMITFIVRVAVLCVLLAVAPLALLFHALPQTEQLAFMWWKAVVGCFAIQLGQSVVLVAAVTVFLTPIGPTVLGFPASGSGWLGILVALAMMWLLVKIPMWVKDYLWLHSRGVLRKVIFALLMLKTVSMAAAGRSTGGGRGRPQPGPAQPGRPGPRNRPGPGPRGGPGPGSNPRPGPRTGAGAGMRHRVDPRQPRPAAGALRTPHRHAGTRPTPETVAPVPGRLAPARPAVPRTPSALGSAIGSAPGSVGRVQPGAMRVANLPPRTGEPAPVYLPGGATSRASAPGRAELRGTAGPAGAVQSVGRGQPAGFGLPDQPAPGGGSSSGLARAGRPAPPGQPVRLASHAYPPRAAVSQPAPRTGSPTPPVQARRQLPHPVPPVRGRSPRGSRTPPPQARRQQPATTPTPPTAPPHRTPPSPPLTAVAASAGRR
jgi:hypothetical protein